MHLQQMTLIWSNSKNYIRANIFGINYSETIQIKKQQHIFFYLKFKLYSTLQNQWVIFEVVTISITRQQDNSRKYSYAQKQRFIVYQNYTA